MKIEYCVNFIQKNKLKISFLVSGIIVLFILIHIFSHLGTDRRVFIYPVSGSSKLQKEVRYLDSNPVQGKIPYYVDELILGPSFYRGRPLFTLGTCVDYCFLREKTLYIGLSESAVLQDGNAIDINNAVQLLKKNIKKNFTSIKNIELFIDGKFITD